MEHLLHPKLAAPLNLQHQIIAQQLNLLMLHLLLTKQKHHKVIKQPAEKLMPRSCQEQPAVLRQMQWQEQMLVTKQAVDIPRSHKRKKRQMQQQHRHPKPML